MIRKRLDYFLIWGHGISFLEEIIKEIEKVSYFEILKIQKYKVKNIKKFIKRVYKYDYVPFVHLKAKTKYLLNTPNEVAFIFINNFNPMEDFTGEGRFRHIESLSIKKFKEYIRDKFNPYKDGVRTHNHVIHASDNETQTDDMLKFLGYKEGIHLFDVNLPIKIPYHLKNIKQFKLEIVNINSLLCKVIEGNDWQNFKVKISKLEDSPHYKGLYDISIYKNYIEKFRGGPLQDYYSVDKYKNLFENFNKEKNDFIIVEKKGDKYIVLDGLHRSSICKYKRIEEIKVCQILK